MTESLLTPILPFPNIYWWQRAARAKRVLWDEAEHFQKMSFRNRYLIAGPDGVLTLSVPVAEGRQQRRAMGSVRTDMRDKWQLRHWRTLQSAYNRSPYFEFYADRLEPLFTRPYELLVDFNRDSIGIVAGILGLSWESDRVSSFLKAAPDGVDDIRPDFLCKDYAERIPSTIGYYQVFADRTGFLPNLSILDLLFNEGPATSSFLR